MSTTTEELNLTLTLEFADRITGVLNSSALALMASLGHRTGLFDAMAGLPPSTSHEIAEAAGLNERYVVEWLGAMVTGRIIDYDPSCATYWLPPAHAAWLTRAASASNMARTFQFIPLLGAVANGLADRARNGGEAATTDCSRFHDLMAEESNETVMGALLDGILPLAPGLIEGLKRGIDVMEVGCGRGRALNLLARTFARSRFTGIDISEEAVAFGKAEARELGLTNVRFEVKDAAAIEESRYDLITAFDAIHDLAQPDAVLSAIARALVERGFFLMQDIAGSSSIEKNLDHALAPFLYTLSCLHSMTVSLVMNGEGLGTRWGEERARQMLADAGFTRVEVKRVPKDLINVYYVATP